MNIYNVLGVILVIMILVYMFHAYKQSEYSQLKCIVSSVNGEEYCVRERSKIDETIDLLASMTETLKKLVHYVGEKHKDDKRVKRLVEKFNPKKIMETLPTSKYTAYSENKGEKLAFCLTEEKNSHHLIDKDTLTFVGIHELSHIMTESIGHKDEFWENFKFLLKEAKEAGIYYPHDYKLKPRQYCGMTIDENPYYDL